MRRAGADFLFACSLLSDAPKARVWDIGGVNQSIGGCWNFAGDWAENGRRAVKVVFNFSGLSCLGGSGASWAD